MTMRVIEFYQGETGVPASQSDWYRIHGSVKNFRTEIAVSGNVQLQGSMDPVNDAATNLAVRTTTGNTANTEAWPWIRVWITANGGGAGIDAWVAIEEPAGTKETTTISS